MTPPNEKHLEFIQAIITRMNSNSFMIKGWSVALVAGLLALAAKDSDKSFAVLAFVPVVVFWGLDAFYLSKEKRYRKLFEDAACGAVSPFEMDASGRGGWRASWLVVAFSPIVLLFSGVLVVAVALVLRWLVART